MSTEQDTSSQELDAANNGHKDGKLRGKALGLMALGALGIVYGDIGTSPLYAFRESFHESNQLAVIPANVMGVLSLIFWALILVISVKYILFVMQADNQGEGGILALTALIQPSNGRKAQGRRSVLIMMGLFGTALLYGDGMITPAISVLSAIEGLEVATPFFQPYIIPITVVILVALFLFQSQGTAKVGRVFGPITLVWFTVLGSLGIYWIVQEPSILQAVNPLMGLSFFATNGLSGFLVLGSVFLVVTGGEALYADMGHFGKAPIRLAWFGVALPGLLLNYFGQGALLLSQPEAIVNPFYRMVPAWALYPVVFLATCATVIASQALITGAFSLTMQAVHMGYLPRLTIEHTSTEEYGQVYIGAINWILMIACVALVLAFRTSSNLAAAYGVAVTTTMVITTLLLAPVAKEHWGWPTPLIAGFVTFFLVIDLSFFGANLTKIPDGGWFPLLIGGFVFMLMTTWKQGREILASRLQAGTVLFEQFISDLPTETYARVPGTAVFMYSDPVGTPPALVHNLAHNKVLHETILLLSIRAEMRPRIRRRDRVTYQELGDGFYRIVLHYGFQETPHIPRDLRLARRQGLPVNLDDISYFLGRERVLATDQPGMSIWQEKLFAFMSRNARGATDFFRLPPERVVELGTLVEL